MLSSDCAGLLAADDDGALGVVQDVVADARGRERPLEFAETARPDDDDACAFLVRDVDDHFARLSALRPDLSRQLQLRNT